MKNTKFLKGLAITAIAPVLALASTINAFAWGPERQTFTMAEPATYPVFNSITDNPTIGDERDFVRVGEIDSEVTALKNEIEVIPGKQYLVYIYFHNNASETFNTADHNHSGIALGTKLASSFSTVLTPSEKGTITGTITANNSNPTSVWDEAYMTTATDKVLLRYVSGSAKIYNDFATNGSILSENLFTKDGTLLGLTSFNGAIPGCEQYHGVVSYILQAEELAGTVDKTVSKDGTNYTESISALPGDEIYYKLEIKNAGDVELTNATITDTLPQNLTLVKDSVELWANNSDKKDKLSDNIIGTGYNLGTIGTGNTIYITYRAKVASDIDCGSLDLVNNAKLVYDSEVATGDTDEDTSTVRVDRDDCELPDEIVSTGPLEIVLAIIIVLGIGGGFYYLYRTRKTLKTVENKVSGKTEESKDATEEDNKNS